MDFHKPGLNGMQTPSEVTSSIPEAPVTVRRKPFQQPHDDVRVPYAGTARANIAPSYEKPEGTTADNWATDRRDKTVLQQHCEFFDLDKDGIIWPLDTFRSLYALGFNIFIAAFAAIIIHAGLSYPTVHGIFPDPFFRIYLDNIHKAKHGSDSGTYDNEGRFVPQKFEEIFSKYADGGDTLTMWDVWNFMKGQRLVMDPFGSAAVLMEWVATWIMLWPEDGHMKKEDIRGIFDGSLFYTMSKQRAKRAGISHTQGSCPIPPPI